MLLFGVMNISTLSQHGPISARNFKAGKYPLGPILRQEDRFLNGRPFLMDDNSPEHLEELAAMVVVEVYPVVKRLAERNTIPGASLAMALTALAAAFENDEVV